MTNWDKNIAALRRQQTFLADKLENMQCDTDPQNAAAQLGQARDGEPIVIIRKDGQEYIMNSRFCPEKEVQIYAKQFAELPEYSIGVFLGFGNGSFARAIAAQSSETVRYLFYEPCKDCFLKVMQEYDLTQVLRDDKVTVFVEGINERELSQYLLAMLGTTNYFLVNTYELPKYKQIYPQQHVELLQTVRNVIRGFRMGLNTMGKYADRQMENVIQHLRYIFYATSAADFTGHFPKDLPAIIVSAGPSLQKNIDVLKTAKNRAFILCADTALRRLLAEGIIPDAVIGVDPVKQVVIREAMIPYFKKIMWITQTDANFRATDAIHSYRNVFLRSQDELSAALYQAYGKELPEVASGGSVSTTAYSLLELWGFQTIILVGQDLALTGDRRYSDSTVSAREEALAKGFSVFEIPAYDGGMVFTRDDYYSYLQWFEGSFALVPEKNIINATQGGARIRGARNMTLQEALQQYAAKEYDIRSILDQVPVSFQDAQRKEMEQYLRKLPEKSRWFCRLFQEGKRLVQRAVTLLKREHPLQNELRTIYKRLHEIEQKVSAEQEYALLSERVCKVQQQIDREIGMMPSEQNNDCQSMEHVLLLYTALLEAAKDMELRSGQIVETMDAEGWR